MKELRDIKIDMLTGNKNPVLDLFNQITDGVVIINCEVYNNDGLEFIYHKDGEWIFYQDIKNEKFWCSYNRYWSLFESKGLKYLEIQSITKLLVEEALRREVVTPEHLHVGTGKGVEEALRREVASPGVVAPPLRSATNYHRKVEEALKREVAQPRSIDECRWFMVEEVLKRQVLSPIGMEIRAVLEEEVVIKREVAPPSPFTGGLPTQVEEALKDQAAPVQKFIFV